MKTIQSRTDFPVEKFNQMVMGYISNDYPGEFQPVEDYQGFIDAYPVMEKAALAASGRQLLAAGKMQGCYVVSTSGTTSSPVILANRFLQGVTEHSYPYQVRVAMATHVFDATDIVANLLTAGGLGNSYEGMCRLLESIGVTILPVGRPDTLSNNALLLDLLERFSVDVLVGSPSGIVQLAQAALSAGVSLPIRKIVFVGEAFHPSKRTFVSEQWPQARFYSIYGATELGFAAINTPQMNAGHHLVLSDWFFVETNAQGELLITDLKAPVVPLIRYKIGDYGQLLSAPDSNEFYLCIGDRVEEEFSLGGHRIRHEHIRKQLAAAGVDPTYCQVTLRSSELGRDRVEVALDLPQQELDAAAQLRLEAILSQIPKLGEALRRGVAELGVVGREHFEFNARQKLPAIRDQRQRAEVLQTGSELSRRIDRLLDIPTEHRRLDELFNAYSELLVLLNSLQRTLPYNSTGSAEGYRIEDCQRKVLDIERLFELELSGQWASLLNDGNKLSRFFYRIYQRMVSNELTSLDGHSGRLCQVGVGAMPLSILLYVQKTSFFVTGIDIDSHAIVQARRGMAAAFEALDIPSERLSLIEAAGADFDYTSYDVVVLSMTVSGRSEVVQRILDTCKQPQVRIVLRDTDGWKQFIYQSVGLPEQQQLELVAEHSGCPISSSVYRIRPKD
ncbi:AMP-binding protein [Pseudomonas sp. NFXW11]|uniref:nicotianamine synthase family protein n=1 Tax=Pseudomonas sp. NFXW11 TaxID=2819531 RepID=UPI003CEBE248